MIKALNIAAVGMIKAQKRATELAADIVETTTRQVSDATTPSPSGTAGSSSAGNGDTPANNLDRQSLQSNSLIQQIVDFKATEIQFRASATAFKRIADTAEETLGTLFDKKG